MNSDWKKALSHDPAKCAVCKQRIESVRSLHAHLKKHELSIADYYETYYPRKNLYSGETIRFQKDIETYFSKDFDSRAEMIKWCKSVDRSIASEYILDKLEKRIIEKQLTFAPCSIQLFTDGLPNIDIYSDFFGTYEDAAKLISKKPIYSYEFDEKKWNQDFSKEKIWIDTREQKPYFFKNQDSMALKVGDYCAKNKNNAGEIYVDRKSPEDFKGTLTVGYERFRKEIERAQSFGFYLFVVIEADITKIEAENLLSLHKYNMKFVFHNMKELINDYPDTVQFIFAKNRDCGKFMTQKLLGLGNLARKTDVQYFLQKGLINVG